MMGLFLHQTVDGVGVDLVVFGQAERLVQVIDAGGAGHQPAAVRLLAEILGHFVVFIPDLADQLFQDVFQRDDALGSAVFVHDYGQMMMLFAQGAEQLGDLGGTGRIQGGCDEVVDGGGLFQTGQIEVLLMDHADDVVDGAVIDRQTGIAGIGEGLRQLLEGSLVGDGNDIDTGRQNFLDFHIVELDGTPDELALTVGQLAVALGLAHHRDEFTFGDGVALTAVNEMAQQLFPLAEQPSQGSEQHHQEVQDGRNKGRDLFGHLLRKAFGSYLTEDQDNDGQHDGGDRCAPFRAEPFGEQDGADRCGRDVHDVVADQDRGEQLIVLLGHCQHTSSGSVAIVGTAFQAYLVQGRKCGLGGGEKGGESHQNHQRHQERNTAIVHKKGNHTQLSFIISL